MYSWKVACISSCVYDSFGPSRRNVSLGGVTFHQGMGVGRSVGVMSGSTSVFVCELSLFPTVRRLLLAF